MLWCSLSSLWTRERMPRAKTLLCCLIGGGATLENFLTSHLCCAVLTNTPNSCPPERLFSMFNASFGEDQQRSFGDYLELAMQSQYNKRNVWGLGLVSLLLIFRFGWALLSSRGGKINTHTHTHTHTHIHRRLWQGLDRLFVDFCSKYEVFVARIKSIISSIFRVKAIDYRFRFLESTRST